MGRNGHAVPEHTLGPLTRVSPGVVTAREGSATADREVATSGAPGSPVEGGPERPARSGAALWLHTAALAAVLVALLAFVGPSSIVVPDEGLYLAQADALSEGDWSVPRQGVDVDRDGEYSRLLPESVMGDSEIPYARHAAYPVVITPAFRLGDYVGTLVVSVLGLWGAAVSAAFIARRLSQGLAVPTLWIVGLGSPLLFYGYVTMGHALAAATAGAAFLGITRWLDDRAWSGLVLGVPALGLTVLLRSEGMIFALGVAGAVGLLSLAARGTRRFDLRSFLTAVLLGCVVVGTYLLDTRITHAVTGTDGYGVNPGAIAMRDSADPVSGSWVSLLRPFAGSWSSGALWVSIAGLALVAASVVLRARSRTTGGRGGSSPQGTGRHLVQRDTTTLGTAPRSTLAIMLLLVGATAAVGMLVDPPWLVTGLFAAFPLLGAGLIQLRRTDLSPPAAAESPAPSVPREPSVLLNRIVLTTLITSAGLVATLYGNGGAAEWGGRFFHLLIPVVAPAAVLGLERGLHVLPDSQGRILSQRHIAMACALGITAALSISALRVQAGIRAEATDTVDGAMGYAGEQSPGEPPLVIVANVSPGGNSRAFWRPTDSTEVLTTIGLERLAPALRRAAELGRDRVIVVTDATTAELDDEVGEVLAASGWSVLDQAATPLGHSNLFTVGAR